MFWQSAFKNHLSSHIDEWDNFIESISVRSRRSFRLTGSRNIPYTDELFPLFACNPVPNVKNMYTLEDHNEKITETISFLTGGLYIMNPSSALPAEILASYMPENPLILDMAAAPGGKTSVLSDLVGRRGLIVANEPSESRLKALHFNLERGGAWNVKTLSRDGATLSKYYSETFDGVLLDAPCSHENHIGVDSRVADQWSPAYVQEMAALQSRLILSAYDCLRDGGVLVYSTCTFSVEENEQIIRHLLDNREDARLIPIEHGFSRGISGDDIIDENVLRVLPHKGGLNIFDGFFVAAVRKGDSSPDVGAVREPPSTIMGDSRIAPTFIGTIFDNFPTHYTLKELNNQILIESDITLEGGFRKTGIVFGKRVKNNNIELSSQALWEFGSLVKNALRQDVSRETAIGYMKGFDTPMISDYIEKLFYYKNIPVGVTKVVDGVFKNKLDRYFLRS
jgi:16S rRNA (cytosine1407-C5)-methyltransferase